LILQCSLASFPCFITHCHLKIVWKRQLKLQNSIDREAFYVTFKVSKIFFLQMNERL